VHRTLVVASAAVAALTLSAFALDGAAYAATGSSLILGRLNTASTTTVLQGGSAPVLSLRSSSASAVPLTVNGTGRVTNLNADRLDSIDSSQLQRRVASVCPTGQAMVGADVAGRPLCRGVEPTATLVTIDDRGPFDDEHTFATPDLPAGRFMATLVLDLTPAVRGTVSTPKRATCSVGASTGAGLSITASDVGTPLGVGIRGSDVLTHAGGPLAISCGFERGSWSITEDSQPRLLLLPLPSVSTVSTS
jgi:hypothetical protein